MLPPSPHAPPNVIAHFLYTAYPPWLSLHMLLKRHKAYFTTKVLEELLSPLEPTSPSLPLPPPLDSPQSQSCRPWKARLSRYLVQRLHLGYYGSRQDLSENTVRYLTARARLEFGYFVIWGRAFWSVSQEDVLDAGRSQLDRDSDRKQGKKAPRAGESDALVKEDGHGVSNRGRTRSDYYGARDDTTTITTAANGRAESAAEEKQRIAQENQRCEEREERLLLLEAARFSARRPGYWTVQEQELADSSFDTGFSFRRVAAARHWRQVALTYFADPDDPEVQGKEASDRYPPSPFLSRLGDDRWMEKIQSLAITAIPLKSPASTTARPTRKAMEQENLAKVLDDCRLFQIASGIFDGQATSGRDKASKQVDEPLTYSPDVMEALIVDFGYMPLPEDDFDRRRHHIGGNRVQLGDGKRFPDDELHCARQKLRHGSIWRYYEIQRLEVMTAYLMFKAPEVLDILFDRGFQFTIRPGGMSEHPETEFPDQDLDSKTAPSSSALGISPALLLQCCLPRCYSMLRNVQKALAANGDTMTPAQVVSKIKRELMGVHGKPNRITFGREDFVEALGGLPCPTLVDFKGNLSILIDLGMEISVVQDRLVELIQISGGVTADDVEMFALSGLLSALTVDWTVGKSYLVNRTIQENFELDMDLTDIRDVSWRLMFEETIQNLRLQRWIVHPRVSDWILETFGPVQSSFRTCFDHAVLEALLEISDWNQSQVKRLQAWTQRQEDEARIKSSKQSKFWKDIKDGLVVERGKSPFSSKRGRKGNHYGGTKHRHNSYNSRNNDPSYEDTIMLDIAWTTGQQVSHATQTILASMPKGSDMVRVSDDGFLMLDNGCLDHELLLYDTQPPEVGANGVTPERTDSLDSNARVSEYLDRSAVVQEKHLVWLALGLVTESFHGHATAISKRTRAAGVGAPSSSSSKQPVSKLDIPVRMACSPEAYQLVWMLVSSYIRQSMNNGDVSPSASNSSLSTAASEASTILTISSGQAHGGDDASSSTTTSMNTISPPTSPMPVSQSGCAARMRALQTMVQQRVGQEEAKLFVEILSEIEDQVEELLG
ncbi:hypothetical protein BG000_005797 [Podila horticola]|nr:hypothetical protein BG000_005797 [Podila horticola]